MKSKLYIGLDKNENFRFKFINSTQIIEQMRKVHHTSTTATAALGRLTTMASIMSDEIKNKNETIILKVKGDGPAGVLIAEANGEGHIRSYITNPTIDIPSRSYDGKLDVGKFVGREGSLVVIQDLGLKEPYTGHTNLVTGEIAEDFARYFYQSQQLPTVISLGVLIDVDHSVLTAGGLFIQAMPGYSEEAIDILEEEIRNFPQISTVIKDEEDFERILEKYFPRLEVKIYATKEVEYRCNCSKDRVERALISLGKEEIQDILDKDQGCELTCQFCNKKYYLTSDDLMKLLDQSEN